MARRRKEELRPLTAEERRVLEQTARSQRERAERVARAKALLAVADGATFVAAAQAAGRRSNDGVAQLVARFNQQGLAAVAGQHGGGPARTYGALEQERILREFRRSPAREQEGTAVWSLTTLQRALRQAPDGLPTVSTFTILETLHQAGYTWQQDRTWCPTGTAKRKRKRKDGTTQVVEVTDPHATEKRDTSSEPMP